MNKLVGFIALTLLGCSGPLIDLPEGNQVLVVEGWITDQATQHWVKVSQTTQFNDSNPEMIITDAEVVIEHLNAGSETLTFNAANGKYQTTSFAGVSGDTYRVRIRLPDGAEITSNWETLNAVSPIDDLRFETFEDTDPETGEDIIVHYPVVTSLDPVDQRNQYRYKGYKNGKLLNNPNELVLLSDEFNNGQSLPHHITEFRLTVNDEITVELHSLSVSAFKFLELLKAQTTSLGSSSGTAPAKLVGNLFFTNRPDEIVLGFFGASSIQTMTGIVSE